MEYVRPSRSASCVALGAGLGPGGSLRECGKLPHPFSIPPSIDPVLEWTLRIATDHGAALTLERMRRLQFWTAKARELEPERELWLQSLPKHSADLYRFSGFHGPLFREMHRHLLRKSYPDSTLWRDVCGGMPTGGILPRSGLWPPHKDLPKRLQERSSTNEAFASAPRLVETWRRTRRPDKRSLELVARNVDEVKKKRWKEVNVDDLAPGAYVAHPEFTVAQADGRNRACDDCSVPGWNATSVSEEKLTLCSASDPVDYGSRLLQADPACAPCIGVADEDSAYRNWANGRPEALIMLVFLRGGLRAWRDYALCFGVLASVYGYNRIRTFLTVFFRVEFALAA